MQNVKIASNTMVLTTANTIFSGKCIYLWNSNTTSAALITYTSNAAVQIGQITMPANTVLAVDKRADESLASNLAAGVIATAIAFTN